MKASNFLKPYLLGVASAIIIFGTFAFTAPFLNPEPGDYTISVADANSQFNRYYSATSKMRDKVKGAYIARDQFTAMSSLLSANGSLIGFRVYGGIDDGGMQTAIVVGVNAEGMDNTNTIYATSANNFGICPVVCDNYSPIISAK